MGMELGNHIIHRMLTLFNIHGGLLIPQAGGGEVETTPPPQLVCNG